MDFDGIWCIVGECYDFSLVFEIIFFDVKLVIIWKKNFGLNFIGIFSLFFFGIMIFLGSDCCFVYVIYFMFMYVLV